MGRLLLGVADSEDTDKQFLVVSGRGKDIENPTVHEFYPKYIVAVMLDVAYAVMGRELVAESFNVVYHDLSDKRNCQRNPLLP